jgi:hypothetical protein
VHLDEVEVALFSGTSWAHTGIAPGQHKVRVQLEDKSAESSKIAEVPAGGVAKLEIRLS